MEPELKTPAITDNEKVLYMGVACTLVLLGVVTYANSRSIRAMHRATSDLDMILTRLLERGRPEGVPPSPPAGRPAEPEAAAKATQPIDIPGNGAKGESGDPTP